MHNLAKDIFGWQFKSWSKALYLNNTAISRFELNHQNILEIGCTKSSSISILYDKVSNKITLSTYVSSEIDNIKNKIQYLRDKYQLKSEYHVCYKDVLKLKDKYDIIIL